MEYNDIEVTDYQKESPQTELPWVERNGFAHWAPALLWVFIGLILFQVVGGIISAILIIPTVGDLSNMDALQQAFSNRLDLVFIGNSAGQLLVIGLASYLLAKLHAVKGEHKKYLRLQSSPNVLKISILGMILFVVVQPSIYFLGWINYVIFDYLVQLFPSLNWFIEMQDSMGDMIKGFISKENAVILAFIHIGIVPAIFEEVMFRGYILRAFEKSWGILAAILLSGLLFGMYHLQPSNILPLATLGILLAYLTYLSESLIPAMIAHLLNNGGQVIAGSMNQEFLEQEMTTSFDMPVYMVIGSVFLVSGILYYMFQLKKLGTDNV